MSSLHFIESKHLQIFIDPDKLRAAAACLDRKRIRFSAAVGGKICPQKDTGDPDQYLEELKTLSVEGGGLSVFFRLPEELDGMKPRPYDPAASRGGTPEL